MFSYSIIVSVYETHWQVGLSTGVASTAGEISGCQPMGCATHLGIKYPFHRGHLITSGNSLQFVMVGKLEL